MEVRLTEEKMLQFFKSQLSVWEDTMKRFEDLKQVCTKTLSNGDDKLTIQFNPARIKSTGADISKNALSKRPCFLCDENRPTEQRCLPIDNQYLLLVNPYPILPVHFTIPAVQHTRQAIKGRYLDMMNIAEQLENLFLFYNGPKCGASAPDHVHFQMGNRGIVTFEKIWEQKYKGRQTKILPLLNDKSCLTGAKAGSFNDETGIFMSTYISPVFVIVTKTAEENNALFQRLYDAMSMPESEEEPMMNILAWTSKPSGTKPKYLVSVVIPREKHRPDCYFKTGNEQCLVSPGALDMAGLMITPRETDFKNLDYNGAAQIIAECGIKQARQLEIVNILQNAFNI